MTAVAWRVNELNVVLAYVEVQHVVSGEIQDVPIVRLISSLGCGVIFRVTKYFNNVHQYTCRREFELAEHKAFIVSTVWSSIVLV